MKEESGKTLSRQWEMLRAIPRAPSKITTTALEAHLKNAGYNISRRTIERDLHALSLLFPLVLDDRSKPFGWSWAKSARPDILPGLNVAQAIALLLAQRHLEPLLPRNLHEELSDVFAIAQKAVSASDWKEWSRRTALISSGMTLLPPAVDAGILTAVQSALAHRKCLRGWYRSKGGEDFREYLLHPLGLIVQGPVLYLMATAFDYEDVRHFALHRFTRIEELAQARHEPEDFDFVGYAASNGARIASRGRIRLVCRFDRAAAEHLSETPMAADQHWKSIESGRRVQITATVEEDDRLRWWLLAFGSQVEVVSPKALRESIQNELLQATRRYTESQPPRDQVNIPDARRPKARRVKSER